MNVLSAFDARFVQPLLGSDECGTGAWAGAITVAAVVLPKDKEILRALEGAGLTDSKQMNRSSRERLFAAMEEHCVWYTVRSVAARELDVIGQGPCLNRLFEQVIYDGLCGPCPKTCIIDGSHRPIPWNPMFIEKGDTLSLAIAAASVVAKVHRDRDMILMDEHYPGYGFSNHVGYGTAEHIEALRRLGPCDLHRRSVKPVRELTTLDNGPLW